MLDLTEKSYLHIRRRLLAGELRPGTRIEEPALARQIGVSRVPVREAIRRLENEGLLGRLPRVGAFVPIFSIQDVQDFIDTRQTLESHAVTRVAQLVTPSDLRDLREIVSESIAVSREILAVGRDGLAPALLERWSLADIAFHMALMRIAGNRRAAKIVGDMRMLMHLLRPLDMRFVAVRQNLLSTIGDHVAIWRAIHRRDGVTAASLMSEHVASGGKKILAHLAREQSLATPFGDWPASHEQLVKAQQTHRV